MNEDRMKKELARPHFTDDDADLMVKWAKQILASYPQSRIFSLGNSPSHIVKILGLMAETSVVALVDQTQGSEIGYIPFTRHFYNWTFRGVA